MSGGRPTGPKASGLRVAGLRVVGRRAAVLGGFAVVVAVVLALIPGHRGWFDVGVYYGTVQHWTDTGRIYDYLRPGTPYGFTYPPFAAVVMLPMALLGWHPAVAVSCVLSAVATGLVLYWLVDPVARREGWPRWYAFGLAACLCALLNPVRDTVSFGQVNLLLVALVLTDWRLGGTRYARFAGIGTGLAAALKLTPALFIGYLLITRPRAAATALGTALAATLLGHLAAPGPSAVFWTEALWDTRRVGVLGYVSNQSLQGLIARLGPPLPGRALWLVAAAAVLAIWYVRVRQTARAGDDLTGWALTGLACCLVSPITWVHHLVWTLPALVLLADAGLRTADPGGRRRLLAAAWTAYLVLCSGVVWLWHASGGGAGGTGGIGGLMGSNAYVYVTLALLVVLPVRSVEAPPPDTGVGAPVVAAGAGAGAEAGAGAGAVAGSSGARLRS